MCGCFGWDGIEGKIRPTYSVSFFWFHLFLLHIALTLQVSKKGPHLDSLSLANTFSRVSGYPERQINPNTASEDVCKYCTVPTKECMKYTTYSTRSRLMAKRLNIVIGNAALRMGNARCNST